MAKKEKHYHLLKRHLYRNGEAVYFCVLNCSFKVNVKLALGKVVLCNSCYTPFEMNEKSIRLAKPKCNPCIETSPKALKTKKEKPISTEDLGIKLPDIQAPKIKNMNVIEENSLKTRMHLLRNPQLSPASTQDSDSRNEAENEADIETINDKEELL